MPALSSNSHLENSTYTPKITLAPRKYRRQHLYPEGTSTTALVPQDYTATNSTTQQPFYAEISRTTRLPD